MEVLLFSFNAVVPLLLMVALGMFLHHRGTIVDTGIDLLSRLAFQVFLPVMIFYNIYGVDFQAQFNGKLLAFTLFGVLGMIGVIYLVLRPFVRDPKMHAAYVHTMYRSNYILLGVPLAQNLFGDVGAQTAAMLIPLALIPYNFIAVILLGTAGHGAREPGMLRKTVVDIARNPLILGCVVGTLVSVSGVQMVGWLDSSVRSLAAVASPFSLIVLGAQLDLRTLKSNAPKLVLGAAVRLVVVPLVMVMLALLAGFRGPELGAIYVIFAAPCATSCSIMARVYDVEPTFTAQMVVITTLLCGVTLFAGISLLRYLQFF